MASTPAKLYFMGSSEGGREALTMAQRYPDDFDGLFARVPVINWAGLQHAGTRAGLVDHGRRLDPPGAGRSWLPTPSCKPATRPTARTTR